MKLTELEGDFVRLYRALGDHERLAVRRALYLGDTSMLRRRFRQQGDQANDLGVLPIAQGDDKSALFEA